MNKCGRRLGGWFSCHVNLGKSNIGRLPSRAGIPFFFYSLSVVSWVSNLLYSRCMNYVKTGFSTFFRLRYGKEK